MVTLFHYIFYIYSDQPQEQYVVAVTAVLAMMHYGSRALFLLGMMALLLSGTSLTSKGNNNGVFVQAIYPDDHFDYSTQINDADQLSSLIATTIDAGKTLFVRWIASAG